jgi:F-type H+-transporting ATPase subunit delta
MAAQAATRPDSVLDIDAQQVGALYAKALLAATEAAGQTEGVLAEFDSLVADVLDRQPKFESVLASGVIPAEEVVGVVDKAFGGRASPLFLNFLRVLAGRGRLGSLRAAHKAAHELYNKLRGRVPVRVTTATELRETLAQEIAQQVRSRLGAEPVLERRVDPRLIAGVMLQIGDTVYDGSVVTQFERLRVQMLDRSVHEIQSRRERFTVVQ